MRQFFRSKNIMVKSKFTIIMNIFFTNIVIYIIPCPYYKENYHISVFAQIKCGLFRITFLTDSRKTVLFDDIHVQVYNQ